MGVNISSVVDLGEVVQSNVSLYLARDLAWSGSVGFSIINTYGDSSHCAGTDYEEGRLDCDDQNFAANSVSVGGPDPLTVTTPFTVSEDSGEDIRRSDAAVVSS
ncbi:hypothetical protein MRB53_042166 [Persea americana]|nr:hypothetical protein MRB53_042166 [Persea americana]